MTVSWNDRERYLWRPLLRIRIIHAALFDWGAGNSYGRWSRRHPPSSFVIAFCFCLLEPYAIDGQTTWQTYLAGNSPTEIDQPATSTLSRERSKHGVAFTLHSPVHGRQISNLLSHDEAAATAKNHYHFSGAVLVFVPVGQKQG